MELQDCCFIRLTSISRCSWFEFRTLDMRFVGLYCDETGCVDSE